jgi:hypothetical protein
MGPDQEKTGASLLPAPVIQDFGIVAPDLPGKAEVGSIRRRPVGGGLGVYEPVPDRTVSGNTAKLVGQWGVSADKMCLKCGEAITNSNIRFTKVSGFGRTPPEGDGQNPSLAIGWRTRDLGRRSLFCSGIEAWTIAAAARRMGTHPQY